MRRIPPLLTPKTAIDILKGEHLISLDLGLTHENIELYNDYAILRGVKISRDTLYKVSKRKNAVFFVDNNEVFQVAISDNHYYKLVPTEAAPTLEIDGVRMHRTKGITPEKDAEEKVKILDLNGGMVLDTCAGLGYTATWALKKGAETVLSCEKEHQVLKIVQMNPWSANLFGEGIHLILGDVFFSIESTPDSYFDFVIHDPPRLTHAGELYGTEFYRRLLRVMVDDGRMFHYTGEPGSKYRGVDLRRGVIRRLESVGFREVEYHRSVFGVTCRKPSA